MDSYTLTEEQAEEYAASGGWEGLPFEYHDETSWDDGGKYQYSTIILKHTETGKYYGFEVTRSGSYFSDYHYEYDGLDPLREYHEVEKVISEWQPKPQP